MINIKQALAAGALTLGLLAAPSPASAGSRECGTPYHLTTTGPVSWSVQFTGSPQKCAGRYWRYVNELPRPSRYRVDAVSYDAQTNVTTVWFHFVP